MYAGTVDAVSVMAQVIDKFFTKQKFVARLETTSADLNICTRTSSGKNTEYRCKIVVVQSIF
jgi:hypothetical protein